MARKDDLQTELTENEDGFCTLQVQSKRGDGTRDEDRVKATLGRNSIEEIEEDREQFLEIVEDTMAERRSSNQSDSE
ncbi:DUF7389 domain-containing protein [Natronococcus jeotgali]|uniref:DUF7389 domain-containing protein n=1 Tax=Natronococcus jeotgali DSM 18795 TaxID=1227498 RepID=L9XAI5_9EURY|nr:hypothetical protein [Natronococcus jeotgali]ELY58730.1 hypothetical protein C492_11595 [Natronococcus jeotgali DSM 18795]